MDQFEIDRMAGEGCPHDPDATDTMTPAFSQQLNHHAEALADHNARINAVTDQAVLTAQRVEKIMWWIIGTLVTSLFCLIGIIATFAKIKG